MRKGIPLLVLVPAALLAACGGPEADESASAQAAQAVSRKSEAKRLFEEETFGGNGRTCATCHGAETGTLSPEEAQARFADDPSDPLFLHDGSDDFEGHGVSRILAD